MLYSKTQTFLVHVCFIVKLRNTLCLCNRDTSCLCNRDTACLCNRDTSCLCTRDTLCLCNRDTMCLCNRDTLCLCHRDAKSLMNRFEKQQTNGACGTSLCAELRYGSDGDSHLGWGPSKSNVFDEKHKKGGCTCVCMHPLWFRIHPYASVCIRMHPYASACVPKPTKYLLK